MRRLFWLFLGVGFGFGTSFWVMRFVKETAARYSPERVSADVTGAIKGFGDGVRLAVADGREAMRSGKPSCAPTSTALLADHRPPTQNRGRAAEGPPVGSSDRWMRSRCGACGTSSSPSVGTRSSPPRA